MIIYDSILMGADYYKAWHIDLYPDGLEKVYSVLIPRKNSFFPWSDKMVVFGYQLFAGRTLVDKFNETFFNHKREDVMETYSYVVGSILGKPASEINADHIGALHDLGYLPIKVKALKEGTEVPMGVPVLTIENTLPEFAWLPNYLETILLSETFVTSTVASVAHQFHLIGKEYGEKYADNLDYLPFQFHDFSQRGQHGVEASMLSGLGHLTSSAGTDAMASILLAEKYYGAKLDKELVGGSVVASEHSVMEAYGLDQFHTYHELIKNNPTGILSLVSDTYDYWEVIDKVLPAEKDAIMARDGKLVVRPDTSVDETSGFESSTEVLTPTGWVSMRDLNSNQLIASVNNDNEIEYVLPQKVTHELYSGEMYKLQDNFGKLNLNVTKDYKVLVTQHNRKSNTNHDRLKYVSKLPDKGNADNWQLRSAKQTGSVKHLTDWERLLIAHQADGQKSYINDSSMTFRFSKERKIERLRNLLDRMGLEYTEKAEKPTDNPNWENEYIFKVKLADGMERVNTFSWVDITDKNFTWAQEFIEELSHWDATIRNDGRIKYDSTIKENSDMVSLIATIAGYSAYQSSSQDNRKDIFSDIHTVHIMKNNKIGGQSRKKKISVDNVNVTAITIKNHKLLVRNNLGTTVVSDNVNNYTGVEDLLVRTLDSLYNTFGGTVNSKGLRVLDPHIGLLHGEGINLDNVRGLLDTIVEGGYSPENIVLGVGAYVYSVLVSRDSFGQAVKAQDVIIDGKEMKIFKDPALHEKKDNIDEERAMKKSLKGAVVVLKDGDRIYAKDDLTIAEADNTEGNLLHTIFEDGKQYNTQTLNEIRKELN